MLKQVFNVGEDDLRKRADVIVARELPILSRGYIKTLAKEGKLLFNNEPISCGYKLRQEGTLVLDYDITELQNIPELELEVIFEDDHLLVIDKPSGVITHSRGKYWDEPSVASSIRSKMARAGIEDMRAGIVHRLDRATSGVIVCAKDTKTAALIQQQFEKRTVQKTYIAIVPFKDIPDSGLIDKPIGRNPRKPSQFKVDPNGKPAQTQFEVVKRTDNLMLIKLHPKTGRTHQLRVHLASLDIPIVGDQLYDSQLEAPRLMLHAAQITIHYPNKDTEATFDSKLPKVFEDMMS